MADVPLPKRHKLMWAPVDEPGIDEVRIAGTSSGLLVFDSMLIRLWEGQPLHAQYHLECDSLWRVRRLQVGVTREAAGIRGLHLEADGAGEWKDAETGQPLTDLRGCIDVDMMFTPLTNTLPIRRLALAPGASREITVVYISAPDLSVRPFRQRYTRLDDASEGHQRYRYESLESGFTAVLPVDDDGLVIEYPGIWRRVWPTE